jgi:hypothetical protein
MTTTRSKIFITVIAVGLAAMGARRQVHGQGRGAGAAVDVDGTLEVLYEDYAGGARLRHFLATPGGQRLQLQFSGEAPSLLTGTRVHARGNLQNNVLALSSTSSLQATSIASAYTFGAQQTLVILINFQDNAAIPYTAATAQSVTFTSASNYYLENTYGQASLTGLVTGWYTIPATSTTCDTSTWASLAEQAATNAGINVSSYPRRIYAFPQTSACAWWGLGTVGGGSTSTPSKAWINGSYALQVVGHEMGHNFGDYHSHSQPCDVTGCTTVEYGDDRDIMGNARPGHMTAFQKERLGWLNYGSSPSIQTVTSTNNYWIEALETAPGGNPKALKILKSIDSSGYHTWYYVDARVQTGFDGSTISGVVIHTGSESSGNSSYEIDLQPGTTTFDSTLKVGQSFVDSALALTISTLSVDGTGAMVQVAFGASAEASGTSTPSVTAGESGGVSASAPLSIVAATQPTLVLAPHAWTKQPVAARDQGPANVKGLAKHIAIIAARGKTWWLGGDYSMSTGGMDSGRNELWSLSADPWAWTLETKFCTGQLQPAGPDQIGWIYDPVRAKFLMTPGYEWGSRATDCPTSLYKQSLSFEPVTKQWALARTDDGSLRLEYPGGIPGQMRYNVFDPVTDSFYAFTEDSRIRIYTLKTNVWSSVSFNVQFGGRTIRLAYVKSAIDLAGRMVYAVDRESALKHLYGYNIDTKQVTDLGDVPLHKNATGTIDSLGTPLEWDSKNNVLYLVQTYGTEARVKLDAYHPGTKQWEALGQDIVVSGTIVKGVNSVYDPAQDVLIIGATNASNPVPYWFLFRY